MDVLVADKEGMRAEISVALGQLGAPAVTPLLEALRHEEPGVRRQAALALGIIAHPQALEPLRQALTDPDEHVRVYVKRALESYWIKGFRVWLAENAEGGSQ